MLAWLALASTVLPVPFVLAPTALFVAAIVVSAALAIGLAVAHRLRTRPKGWIVADANGVRRKSAKKTDDLVRFDAPFGVTLLANQARRRALLAITTPTATRFAGVRLDGPAASVLLEDASIVADGDALAAHAADEDSMSAEHALAILRFVRERAPMARQRLYLSGTHGEQIVLEGAQLRVESPAAENRYFDLESPVEWRGFLFHEALGPAASIYQATWVRQGSSELVFVAPMPTELLLGARRAHAQVLAPSEGEPPPGHLRTGIERVFMLPVREALAKAPRPSRAPLRKLPSSPDLGA
ncbi:MAG TPA: hypothetical protein VGH28_32665 [Polyangiaceae bacterium]